MKKINVAILGLGTVGKGVIDLFEMNGEKIEKQLGCKINFKTALVRDLKKYKKMELPKDLKLTTNFKDIISDTSIQIVIEVMGGETPAKEYIEQCLKNNMNIVSANKDLIASSGVELLKLAIDNKKDFLFEASVAGGIPIINPIRTSLAGNRIEEIIGIINGTTNFILTNMTKNNLSFQDALEEAQREGYAESNPIADVGGLDAARKITILGTFAFNAKLKYEDVFIEGIEKISSADILHAKELGYTIKLLAMAKDTNKGVSLSVFPALLPLAHPLASVNGVNNAVYVKGNCVDDVMFYGKGAGSLPTASSVVGDLIQIVHNIKTKNTGTIDNYWRETYKTYSPLKIESPYYFRMFVENKAGVLAIIADAFAKNDISIRSVVQILEKEDVAQIIIITMKTAYGNVNKAVKMLNTISAVKSITNVIRVIE